VTLDLNDYGPQQPERHVYHDDLKELSRRLGDCARSWVPEYFKNGVLSKDRRTWRLANTLGDAPHGNGSCEIQLSGQYAGHYRDWSTDEHGDALDTLKLATRLDGAELYERAAEIVGTPRRKSRRDDKARQADVEQAQREIETTLSRCKPARDTPVETYLNSRGLDLPDCDDILFHPDLNDYANGMGRPGMVIRMRHPQTGELVDSIHRTFLADDGSGKADMEKPKKLRGSPVGGVAMLMPMGEDGVLGVGEGIETSLAGSQIFGIPAWATLSDGGTKTFAFPPGLKELHIFADKGVAGEGAAAELWRPAAGITAWVRLPRSNDDLAKDLELGLGQADAYPLSSFASRDSGSSSPSTQRRGVVLIHFRDMEPRIEDRSIVRDLLNEGEISAIIGASGTSKTFIAIDMAMHIAAGWPWFGRRTRQMGVIYIAAEAGRGIQNRVAAFKKHHQPDDLPFAAIVSPVNLRERVGDNGLHEVIAAIQAVRLSLPVGLIIVDTLNRSMGGGEENTSQDMGQFITNIDALRDHIGAHVLIVHHLGKDETRGSRGHTSFPAALDTEIVIKRDNATGISIAKVTKQRELPTMGRFTYTLHSVELDQNQYGEPVTSCVVEPVDLIGTDSDAKEKQHLAPATKRALDLLVDAVARYGEVPSPNDFIPPDTPCVRESYWRERCYAGAISDSDEQDAKQKAFKRAAKALLAANRIGKHNEWVWPVATRTDRT
jgi:hypothetical protein